MLAVSRRMILYGSEATRRVPREPALPIWSRDNGHTVVAERGERAALQRRLPVVADDYQPGIPALGSFFVSSQPNMMSFTASLSNRFGAWQNRVGWLALRWNRKSKLCS